MALTAPAPTGLTVPGKQRTSLTAKWNSVKGATGYYVRVLDNGGKVAGESDIGAQAASATIGGLSPGQAYTVEVYAQPGSGDKGTGAHATARATLPKSG
jgi:hypothetical protein